ncbi:hypothetical protein NDU88_011509 [Pleurodeles waltl]|uniref:Gypsy retrotransposon integrase-like protein 1 n=1 Tax=Pleurodeles waltl TaxID=8319 RepID=A0AAV7S213_PLEWA|nr:hypothetical protein NDU88_011509 [Pleurodeles waltl]
MGYCRHGWPNRGSASCDAEYIRHVGVELCMVDGVMFRGELLVVPTGLRERVLELAQEGHLGMSATKRRIRSEYWWPGLDREVEHHVRECVLCAWSDKSQKLVKKDLVVSDKSDRPWKKIAIDIMGPFNILGSVPKYALVVVDYFSR